MTLLDTETMMESQATALDKAERALVDSSTRMPVIFFFGSAVKWLLVGTLLGLISSLQAHNAFFGVAWLNYGRTWPAYINVMLWGWAGNAGLGVTIWLLCRLCRRHLSIPKTLTIACLLWNFGVFCGTLCILGGGNTGIEGFEYPPAVSIMLLVAYLFVAVWAFVTLFKRKSADTYVSQWYLLASLLCFPWILTTAQILLFGGHVQGVMQSLISGWFFQNLMALWLIPIGLASAYYFIPKVVGRPIYSYYLAAFGFWSLLVFSGWSGTRELIGGPLPMWISTIGSVANILLLVPVIVVAINHHMTMKTHFGVLVSSPTLRFTVAGAMCYTAYSILSALSSIRWVDSFTHFTHFPVALFHVGLLAFFSMTMFGAMYYILPRLTDCEWRSPFLIKIHFWGAFYGILLMVTMLALGGIVQGVTLGSRTWENWDTQFVASIWRSAPYLVARTLAWALLAVSNGTFAYHFFLMIGRAGKPAGSPTLFDAPSKKHGDMHKQKEVLV